MPINVEKLSSYYESFKKYETEKDKNYSKERREKKMFFKQKLSTEKISELEKDDIKEMIKKMWAFQWWANKDYLIRKMTEGGIGNLKKNLTKALYETPNKGKAFLLLCEVRMFGPASASELLTYIYPDECGIWNKRVEEGLRFLSYSNSINLNEEMAEGEKYERFIEILIEIKERLENFEHEIEDLLEINYFLIYAIWDLKHKKEQAQYLFR